MRSLFFAILGCLMLTGCTSSGQPGFFGQPCALGVLIAGCPEGAEIENYGLQQGILEAQSFCEYLGQKVYVTSDGTKPLQNSTSQIANIVFQCLQPNDKRLNDPKAKSDGYVTYAPS